MSTISVPTRSNYKILSHPYFHHHQKTLSEAKRNLPIRTPLILSILLSGVLLHAEATNTVSYLPHADRYIQKNAPDQSDDDLPTRTLKETVEKLQGDLLTVKTDLKASLMALTANPDDLFKGNAGEAISKARESLKKILETSDRVYSRLVNSRSAIEDASNIPTPNQKELNKAVVELCEACKSTATDVRSQLKGLNEASTQIVSWKKIYRYYNNLVGKEDASTKLKESISSFLDKLDNPAQETNKTNNAG